MQQTTYTTWRSAYAEFKFITPPGVVKQTSLISGADEANVLLVEFRFNYFDVMQPDEITTAMVLDYDGRKYTIVSIMPDFMTRRDVKVRAYPATDASSLTATQDRWADIASAGESAVFRRLPSNDVVVRVKSITQVAGEAVRALPGGSVTQRHRFLALRADFGAWPLPIRINQDRMIIGGRTLSITAADDLTHRVGGVTMAIEIEAAGA
jgi:hypothetical protein